MKVLIHDFGELKKCARKLEITVL